MTYFFDGSKEAFLTAFLLAYCDERAIVTAGSCQLALGQECVFVRADEEKARRYRCRGCTEESEGCSMCGDVCAIKIVNTYMSKGDDGKHDC